MTRTEMQTEMEQVECELREAKAAWYAYATGPLSAAIRSRCGEAEARTEIARLDAITTALRVRRDALRTAVDAIPQTRDEHDAEIDRRSSATARATLSLPPVRYRGDEGGEDSCITRDES